MRRGLVKVILFLCVMVFVSSCTTRLTDFTIITTKNVDLSRMKEFKRGAQRAKGEDAAYVIFIIPTKAGINFKEAIDKAIQSVPGCVALVDGVLYQETIVIPILFIKQAYVVEGTPLIDPKLVSELPSNHMVVKYDDTKKDFVTTYVDKDEYDALKTKVTKGL